MELLYKERATELNLVSMKQKTEMGYHYTVAAV